MGYRVSGLGCSVEDVGFGVHGSGFNAHLIKHASLGRRSEYVDHFRLGSGQSKQRTAKGFLEKPICETSTGPTEGNTAETEGGSFEDETTDFRSRRVLKSLRSLLCGQT